MNRLLFFLSFLTTINGYCQDDKVVIPTPESASLIKWSQNEVNYSSGALNTTIPLYTLSDGGLTVPIALHYNGSSGIKVEETATSVGLGWDLVAGGKIVRVVRDKPDESYTMNDVRNEQGGVDAVSIGVDIVPKNAGAVTFSVDWKNDKIVYRAGWYLTGNPVGSNDFNKRDPVLFDTQPDLYIAYIGNDVIKFTFDNNQQPVILNNKDYKIEIDWEFYNPSWFYTKQSWSAGVTVDFAQLKQKQENSSSGMNEKGFPTKLGLTVGLNQFFRKDTDLLPKIIGFKGFTVISPNGTKYFMGGAQEYMDFNYNDQSYLNDADRLSIAVDNISQRIPSAWNLRRIESAYGNSDSKNYIDFKYKRTGFYEPFHSSDDLVDPENECSVPISQQERYSKNIYVGSNIKLDKLLGDVVDGLGAGIGLSYTQPTAEELAAYVTLNSRVVFGLLPDSIVSPNFIVKFNSKDLFKRPIKSSEFKKIIPDFDVFDFDDISRRDIQPEGTLSSEEEKRKDFFTQDPVDGSINVKKGNLTVDAGTIVTVGLNNIGDKVDEKTLKDFIPSVSYQGEGYTASLNGSGLFFNVQGDIYQVNSTGEFNKILNKHFKIRNIEIIDRSTRKSKGFYFDYDYFKGYYPPGFSKNDFTAENMYNTISRMSDIGMLSDLPQGFYNQLHTKYGIDQQYDRERLMLKGVYELKFSNDSTSILPGHTFSYDNTPMPRRLSMAQDHWGYYNGQHDNRNKTQLISLSKYATYNALFGLLTPDGILKCPNSSDMRPNLQFAQAGILKGIYFPTGAEKHFEYELHSSNNYSAAIGGLRIKRIKTVDAKSSSTYYENYSYKNSNGTSSGFLAVVPEYYFSHTKGNAPNVVLSNYYNFLQSTFINDGYISYNQVQKRDSALNGKQNGYEIYEFLGTEAAAKQRIPILEDTTGFGGPVNGIPYNYGLGPKTIGYYDVNSFAKLNIHPYYDYSKNSLKSVSTYNSQHILVKKTEYIYSNPFALENQYNKITAASVVSRTRVFKLSVGVSLGIYFMWTPPWVRPDISADFRQNTAKSAEVYPYDIIVSRYDLLTEKETIWDINGQNPVSSEKHYRYSNYHYNPIEISTENSKGQVLKTIVKYSKDLYFNQDTPEIASFTSLQQLDDKLSKEKTRLMWSKNLNLPIVELSSVNNQIVGGKFTEYYDDQGNFHTLGLPKKEYQLELEIPMPESTFEPLKLKSFERTVNNQTQDGFEIQKFIMYEKSEFFIPRVFIDEYNSKGLPTKYHKSGDPVTQVGYGFYDLIPTSKTVAFGTPLARTTHYDYIPLYGLTRVINPNLTAQKYDYDEVGRLKAVRNEQNEILKSYVYKILGF